MTSSLHFQTGLRNNKTYLKSCYFTTPFKVANITEHKGDCTLQLMLMSSSPGILDGDNYQIKIELAEGCALQLQTQSYQRLFNMKKGASQSMEVYMSKGSSFCYLPHPSVPHTFSDFVATNTIYLSDGCNLIWGEVLTCGRKLNGESFQFTRYQNRTEIFLNNKLAVKENLLVRPSVVPVDAIGQFEGYTHQASLLYLNEAVPVNDFISEIHTMLSNLQDVTFGVSALPVNGVVVRLLGYKAEQLFICLKLISVLINAKEVV